MRIISSRNGLRTRASRWDGCQQGLGIEQRAQLAQSSQRNARPRFVVQLRTDRRVQHPARQDDLQAIRQQSQDAVSCHVSMPAHDQNFLAE